MTLNLLLLFHVLLFAPLPVSVNFCEFFFSLLLFIVSLIWSYQTKVLKFEYQPSALRTLNCTADQNTDTVSHTIWCSITCNIDHFAN